MGNGNPRRAGKPWRISHREYATDQHSHSDRFRSMLRVYDVDARDNAIVEVRFYTLTTNELLATTRSSLVSRTPASQFPVPFYPGYAQLSAFETLLPKPVGTTALRIEIVPVTPGLRYWAFVSVTNNETQHFTTITPQ